jgi:hypothetical protein
VGKWSKLSSGTSRHPLPSGMKLSASSRPTRAGPVS